MKKLWCVMAAVAAASAGADVTVFDGGAAKTAVEEGAWTVSGDFDLSSCGRLMVEFAEPLPQATRLEIQVLGEHPVEALSNGTGGGRDIGQFFVYSLPSDACTSLTVNLPPDVPAFRDVLNRMVGVRPWGLWRRLWKDPSMREVGSCKWWSVDPKRVKGVRVIRLGRTVASLRHPGVAPAIAVKRVTAHGDPARIEAKDLPAWAKMSADRFYPFLDRYGQFKWYDWPGKVRSDADLAAARTAEEKDLAAHPGPANRDKWGGWSNGPKRPADGTWRTAKEDGKWWIVDPDGNLWWSHGVVRVSHSCGMSPVKGREDHFEGLPEAGDEFAAFYRTRDELLWPYYVKYGCTNTYDFTAANLRRKYGPDWENVWGERVHRRLRSWGANTIANSSDRKVTARGGTPYCDRFEIKSKPIAGTTALLAWWPFRDPFDPSFRADIRRQLEIHRAELADPWCFGFFVDNELQWGDETDLAKWTWASPDDQAAKVAFKAWLKARHGAVPAKPSDDDCRAFSLEIVRAYFSTVREEVKAAAPGKLYLGCRFSGAEAFVIDEAQKYCDVMSFNHYDRDVKALVDSWPKGFDKPVMIGEFHFGALDRGPFTTGIISLDGGQAERAQTYVRYLTSALENPCIVGTHWHQYADDVSTGRFDGENMQIGWTDVCDTPYAETIAAVRDIGERMYGVRHAARVADVCRGGNAGYTLEARLDRPDGLYAAGETARLRVRVLKDGRPVGGVRAVCSWNYQASNTVEIAEGGTVFELKSARPGHVLFRGDLYRGGARVTATDVSGHTAPLIIWAGALFSPEKLGPSRKRPADFDAFWEGQVAAMRRTAPLVTGRVKMTPVAAEPGFVGYDIELPCVPRPVSAYLMLPADAAPGRCPAVVSFNGYGVLRSKKVCIPGKISLNVNSFGFPNGRDDAAWAQFMRTEAKDFQYAGWDDREACFFRGQVLRAVRALEWVKTLPEWNRRDLAVTGASMGGSQALQAAAMDADVTLCVPRDPALCDHAGLVLAEPHRPGWPWALAKPLRLPTVLGYGPVDPKALATSDYYDNVFFASRIRCPFHLAAGLADDVCAPWGVRAAYNAVRGPKTVTVNPHAGHVATVNPEGERAILNLR